VQCEICYVLCYVMLLGRHRATLAHNESQRSGNRMINVRRYTQCQPAPAAQITDRDPLQLSSRGRVDRLALVGHGWVEKGAPPPIVRTVCIARPVDGKIA